MDTRPDALYYSIAGDLSAYTPFGPAGLGDMPPDASYKQFASAYLLSSVLKKFIPKDTRLPDQAAKGKFLASNKKCEDWELRLDNELDAELFGEFQRQCHDFLYRDGQVLVSSMFDLLERARTGPGSAIGANGFSFYAKFFSSRLTVTSPMLYFAYRDYIEWFPEFDEADAICRQKLGSPRVVSSSRVSFAPKTRDCSRMICVEPSLNMYFQLGLGKLIEDQLERRFNIRLESQPVINQRLARLGSKTGWFATIDLSSASDSISLKLCERLFPSWFYDLLLELRSPNASINGENVKLNMISTMGNGFTFPLQTMIFSCLIRAAYRVSDVDIHSGMRGDLINLSCFGDDLIVDTKVFQRVLRLLKIAGFETNVAKTFNEGPFRESCGTDWFCGRPVRPIFVKKLGSLQDIFVAINLLNEWTGYTGIPLPRAISTLLGFIRSDVKHHFFVPFDESNDAGIRVPSLLLPRDALAWDENKSLVYRPFRSIPKTISVGDGTVRVPRGLKKLIFNPPGLELAFIYGELRNDTITVRHDHVRYRRKARCTPNWDRVPRTELDHGTISEWQQWETAVFINLNNP